MSETATQVSTPPLTVLAFMVGHSLCALDVRRVLFLAEYRDDVRRVPVAARGVLGLTPARGEYVPLHDLAQVLGVTSLRDEAQSLIELLNRREQEHVEWLDALSEAIIHDTPFEKTTDPHACAFGRWYDSFKSEDEELRETLKMFDAPHQQIHGLAVRVLKLAAEGHRDRALETLRIDGITTLGRLRTLFELARERLVSSIHPVTILLADDHGRPQCAWLVDVIHNVREFAPEAMYKADALGVALAEDGLIKAMLRDADSDLLWLDPGDTGRNAH